MPSNKSSEVRVPQTDGVQQGRAATALELRDGACDQSTLVQLSAGAFALIRAAREGLRPSDTERARIAAILDERMRAAEAVSDVSELKPELAMELGAVEASPPPPPMAAAAGARGRGHRSVRSR
jgi:hypothetical protein